MKEELNKKIDNLINLLDSDSRIIKLVNEKNKLLNNKELLDNINKLKRLDKYSDEYKILKNKLFNDYDFVSFKELENEINFLILQINTKLKELTNERRCNSANN